MRQLVLAHTMSVTMTAPCYDRRMSASGRALGAGLLKDLRLSYKNGQYKVPALLRACIRRQPSNTITAKHHHVPWFAQSRGTSVAAAMHNVEL